MNFPKIIKKKEDFYKIIALLLLVLGIISFYATADFTTYSQPQETNNLSYFETEVVTNATIKGYKPYIIVENLSISIEELKSKIKEIEEIREIEEGYVISLEKNYNIKQIYSKLRELNISGISEVTLTLPSSIEVESLEGKIKVYGSDLVARIEPLFEKGERVEIKFLAGIENKKIIKYGNVIFLPKKIELETDCKILSLLGTESTVEVKWEDREKIRVLEENLSSEFGKNSIRAVKRDYVLVKNLSNKERLPEYVENISGSKVYVGNYSDKEKIKEDFNNVEFPTSYITVKTNLDEDLIEEILELHNLTLDFNLTKKYIYKIKIVDKNKNVHFKKLETKNEYEINETLKVKMIAYVINEKIISIESLKE